MKNFREISLVIFYLFIHFTAYSQFGKLPSGYNFKGGMSQVQGELSIIYPSGIPVLYSENFELETESDSSCIHLLLITKIDSFYIEEADIQTDIVMASLWVPLKKAPQVPSISDNNHILELQRWCSNREVVRYYRGKGLDINYADMDISFDKDSIQAEIKTFEDHFKIQVRNPQGISQKVDYTLPSYTTTWSWTEPEKFTLYTYYGHYNQAFKDISFQAINPAQSLTVKELQKTINDKNVQVFLESNWQSRFAEY